MRALGPGLLVLPAAFGSGGASAGLTAAPPPDCDLQPVLPMLADPDGTGVRPRLIASFVFFGSELLFRTQDGVLAGPYHRDRGGIMDVYALFSAPDDAAALAVVRRRGVDLILICPHTLEQQLYSEPLAGTDRTAFIDRLAEGLAPAWAVPVTLPAGSALRLFRVVPPRDGG